MTTYDATSAIATVAQPAIETVGQVAAEITRLYTALDKAAIDLTPDYIKQRLAGEEGVTWSMFPRIGFMSRPTPILDSILRQKGAILLGAGYSVGLGLLNEYRLTRAAMLIPTEGKFVRGDAVTVRRAGRGFDPGDEYVVYGDQILKATYGHTPSLPSVGGDGRLAWSIPRDWVSDTFRVVTDVDSELQEMIERLRAYEPAVASAE